jgi:hypothetical protein
MEDQVTQETQAPQVERLPFDVEFQKRVEEFSAQITAAIPELAAIAIVPLWGNKPEKSAAGWVHLRNPNPPYMRTLLGLLERVSAFGGDVLSAVVGQIQMYNMRANELTEKVDMLETQLIQLNQAANPQEPIDDK